jgi:hypothetical protein
MMAKGKIRKGILALGTVALVSASVLGIVIGTQNTKRGRAKREPVTDTLPPLYSDVKDLEMVRAGIRNQGKPDAEVFMVIKNNADAGVTSYTVSFGEVSIGKDGGLLKDDPEVIIEPHGETTFTFALSDLEKDVPIEITGVTFADGREDGLPVVLKRTHDYRAEQKAERDAKQGGSNR